MPHLATAITDDDMIAMFLEALLFSHAADLVSFGMVFLNRSDQFYDFRLLSMFGLELKSRCVTGLLPHGLSGLSHKVFPYRRDSTRGTQ